MIQAELIWFKIIYADLNFLKLMRLWSWPVCASYGFIDIMHKFPGKLQTFDGIMIMAWMVDLYTKQVVFEAESNGMA